MTTLDDLAHGAARAAHDSVAALSFDDPPGPGSPRLARIAAVATVALLAVGLWFVLHDDPSGDLDTVAAVDPLPESDAAPILEIDTAGLTLISFRFDPEPPTPATAGEAEAAGGYVQVYFENDVLESATLRRGPLVDRPDPAVPTPVRGTVAEVGDFSTDGILALYWNEDGFSFSLQSPTLDLDRLLEVADALAIDDGTPRRDQDGLPFGLASPDGAPSPTTGTTANTTRRDLWFEAADGEFVRLTVQHPGTGDALFGFTAEVQDPGETEVRGRYARRGNYLREATAIGWIESGLYLRLQITGLDNDERLREMAETIRVADDADWARRYAQVPVQNR
jgi:hypothetical protein